MSGPYNSEEDEGLFRLGEWDVDHVVGVLRITTEEILEVPAFRNRAKEWIKEEGEG